MGQFFKDHSLIIDVNVQFEENFIIFIISVSLNFIVAISDIGYVKTRTTFLEDQS